MNQEEHHAEERARQAYLAWQEAQQRRTRAADRAARLALELQRANERLERKTHARADHLARLKRDLEARAVVAQAAYARRVALHQERFAAVKLPVRQPLPRYVAPLMIAMTVFASQVVTGQPDSFSAQPITPVAQPEETLKLKLSRSLSPQRIP